MRRYGPVPRPVADRLWESVVRGEGCWERPRPYQTISGDGRWAGAHRVSWELAYGPIPPGLYVCHHCDNPRCIRPDHLFLGTNRDNQLDARAKGRSAIGDTNGRRILSSDAVRTIRRRVNDGETRTALAREFGVSRPTIGHAVSGRNWRAVE